MISDKKIEILNQILLVIKVYNSAMPEVNDVAKKGNFRKKLVFELEYLLDEYPEVEPFKSAISRLDMLLERREVNNDTF